MRMIDAEEVIKAVDKHTFETKDGLCLDDDISIILEDVPTVEERKWIPCRERLPEESGRYLISVLDGVGRRTTVAPYQPRYKAWTMTGRMAYWKVIAWMPLPESYRAERRTDEKKDI